MDWIEKVFGVDPDGGNGMLELLIIALIVVMLVSLTAVRAGWRPRLRRARRDHDSSS